MRAIDYEKFAVMMATLAEVFNDGKEVSKIKTEIYFKSLESYPIENISQAVTKMISTRVFPSFPKPAEIIQEINGKAENKATEAWIMAINAIRRAGNYDSVVFADPVIHSVIQVLGGWPKFCEGDAKDEHWKQKEFEKLYAVISSRNGKHPAYLPGLHEINNTARGYDHKPEVIRIGFEKEKIKMIQDG